MSDLTWMKIKTSQKTIEKIKKQAGDRGF